jgi:acyl-coenzyme A thioesterase PaaI-like protein
MNPRGSGDPMKEEHNLYSEILKLFKNRLGEEFKDYQFPPPVFTTMQGEFIALDLDHQSLTTRFPVDERYLNPYGLLQGGIIAAAVDNTFGPLSAIWK